MKTYRFEISGFLDSDLTLEELNERLDIGLLKYSVSENIPEGDEQSISLEGYNVIDFDLFNIEEVSGE